MSSDRIHISPENRGPIIDVISWIFLVITCLAALSKVWSKWTLIRSIQNDDLYLVGATLTAVGWIVAISCQVDAGLGRHIDTMTTEEIERYQQTAYSSQFLYLLSLFSARMTILDFMSNLARDRTRYALVKVTVALNTAVTVAAIFAVAFQCFPPHFWEILSNECFDQTSFWIAYGIMDVLVDLATVLLPFFLLHDLRTRWKLKLPAITAFALRFLIIPVIITRLAFVKTTAGSTDRPYSDFPIVVATSVQVNLSVIFTCLPFLKIVMDNIHSGFMSGEVNGRSPTQLQTYKAERTLNTKSSSYHMSFSRPFSRPLKRLQEDARPIISRPIIGKKRLTKSAHNHDGSESQEKMVINQTFTISIEHENRRVKPAAGLMCQRPQSGQPF